MTVSLHPFVLDWVSWLGHTHGASLFRRVMDGGQDVKSLYLHLADGFSTVPFMHHPVGLPMHEINKNNKAGNSVAALVKSEISYHRFGDRP
jgi:hypothetical protein